MKGKNLGRWRSLGSRPRQKRLKQLEEHRKTSSSDYRVSQTSAISSLDLATSPGTLGCVPRQLGSIASTMSLADSVEPRIFDIVLRFSSISKQLLFSIEQCIFFERRVEHWVAPLALDAAYLHANIASSLYYRDVILSPTTSRSDQRTRYYHHTKAVSLLRERINSMNEDIQLSNNTVSIILILAGQAFIAGNLKTAMQHLEGIHTIINLRGGFSAFKGNEKLATEILRCDLGMVMHSGTESLSFPTLLDNAWPYPSLSTFLDDSSRALNPAQQLADLTGMPHDHRLTSIWGTMFEFCSVINLATASQRRITMETFLNSMASTLYRLVDMHFTPSSVNEVIRLGLLSLCCSVFLHWQRLGVSYPYLVSLVQDSFPVLNGKDLPISKRLSLWLLMIASISVLSPSDEDWVQSLLRQTADVLGLDSWDKARSLLSPMMWIGYIHDKTGKRVFESALLRG
ncbi:hypothetical protein NPX13_g6976 [Xylaria arbuscula]|uniref:Transcription factor domain-containing protein n=1 Tax=Xylaria arbuscula TaxID=114810 RepID=A0A9W8NBU8_9PEZI|nr:hypothetical protein NPX13_g6976 [Xylaria arbuscula]